MDGLEKFVLLLPLAVIAYIVWRFVKAGSLTGALLGGRVRETVGEIELKSSALITNVVQIHILETKAGQDPTVAVVVKARAAMASSMVAFKLSPDQARELAGLLDQASRTRPAWT